MDSIRITGKQSLYGEVEIQGSKNAALPILAASVLIKGEVVLHNCPRIQDTRLMLQLLRRLGARITIEGHTVSIQNEERGAIELPKKDVQGMRSSIVLLGAMLGRYGEAVIYYPGGCVIGERPIDLHLMALQQLGASITIQDDCIIATAKQLTGTHIHFPIVSVGATQNAILAAVLAKGTTVLSNASREPEVEALCDFLRSAGAIIKGVGTRTLTITGNSLHPVVYSIPLDRIVAGTYLLAAAGAGGDICLTNAPIQELNALLHVLSLMDCFVRVKEQRIYIKTDRALRGGIDVTTQAYPGFPTDLQPQLTTVLTKADADSYLKETVFEQRFAYLGELEKMGANITKQEHGITIHPIAQLKGTVVEATDLRAGAALVIAGIMAEGESLVKKVSFIERGYEDIIGDFQKLGVTLFKE